MQHKLPMYFSHLRSVCCLEHFSQTPAGDIHSSQDKTVFHADTELVIVSSIVDH